MRYKPEAFVRFKEFRFEVENQTDRKIKTLRSDRDGEYLSGEFLDYLKENGIVSQWIPPGTPQLNGVAERRNQTLLDMVRSMMSFTKLPLSFWGYALETAATLLNIAPSKSMAQTPYQIWHDKPASYKYLRVWGSPANIKRLVGDKIDSRSSLCRFIDYPKETAGYYFYNPSKQNVFASRNSVFLERGFLADIRRDELLLEESSEAPQSKAGTSSAPIASTNNVPILHRSSRVSQPPGMYGFLGMTGQLDSDSKTYGEAMLDINLGKWLEVMKFEMDTMSSNQVCTLVAKGYTQRPGVDFEEIFSPVAMAKFIRIMFAIAAWYDYDIWQMDVKMAFLNGFIEEEIYMDQLEDFMVVEEEQKVCHLQRSIYGLKQPSRSWNIHFDKVIRDYDFVKNDFDPCVYKKVSGSSIAFLMLYVDDILPIENDVKMLEDTKAWLSTQFSMKDLGEASYILGIKIFRDRSKRMLGMTPKNSYVEKVLKRIRISLNSGVVAWKSSKQDSTANSTTEAEYKAASEAAEEAVWMKNYIQELGVVPSIFEPVVIFCDNNRAIAQANEPRSHHRSKHILRRYHLLKKMVGRGDARMDQVNLAENTVDSLTKPVSRITHAQHLEKMGLRQMSDWL
ncbi:UNVERIFIED_CONTAM: Retrovirus-related Pol polyprotein from transposon TNT 1-94 [Sesamum radiatum]|uniref:Retrovirus-related Pol polyprotein from transposon TNT 1-94 n=1 Tax=Sesamum radiatum TaxID=300843 RepID=A0AAW2RED7_SESRA